MIDFCNAIEAGLRHADAADSAEAEIAEMLETLMQAIEITSNGSVTLALPDNLREGGATRSIELISTTVPDRSIRIATYRTSADGYPVLVHAFGHALSANDAESLRHIFETMLERSEVGRHLRLLMRDA